MTYPIIALMGKKRAGKDTFAQFLVDDHGYTAVAFADTLREILLELDPFIPHPLYTAGAPTHLRLSSAINTWGWEGLKTNAEPLYRWLLRDLGGAIGKRDSEFFTKVLVPKVKQLRHDTPVVVTDVRFPAEFTAMEQLGAHFVRVHRPAYTDDLHDSETAIDGFPAQQIENDSSLEHLRRLAAAIASSVLV